MSGPVPVTILLVQDLSEIPARLDQWVADLQPTTALVFSGCAQIRPDPCATLYHMPAAQWLTLPCCLCCMAPTDPRLILLRAPEKGAGAPAQPVDHRDRRPGWPDEAGSARTRYLGARYEQARPSDGWRERRG